MSDIFRKNNDSSVEVYLHNVNISPTKRGSTIEVLSSGQVNHLRSDGRVILQIMPGNTPSYYIVEHIDKEVLLKREDDNDEVRSN